MKKTLILVSGARRSGQTTIAAHIARYLTNKRVNVEMFGRELIEVLQPEYYWSHTAKSLLATVNRFRQSSCDFAVVDTTMAQGAEILDLTSADMSSLEKDGVRPVFVVTIKGASVPIARDVVSSLGGSGTIPIIVRRVPVSGTSRSAPPAPCLYCEISEYPKSLKYDDWRSPLELAAWTAESQENAAKAAVSHQEYAKIMSCLEVMLRAPDRN